MKNRKSRITLVSIMLVISITNFFTIQHRADNIRMVDFLSIFIMGALTGLLIAILAFPSSKE